MEIKLTQEDFEIIKSEWDVLISLQNQLKLQQEIVYKMSKLISKEIPKTLHLLT